MSNAALRHMTPMEKGIVDRLLFDNFPGRDEIAIQIADSLVKAIDECGSLEIRTNSSVKASAVTSRVPAEGEAVDSDGVTIHFLLHVVDDKVSELEIYKENNSRIQVMPAIRDIQVFSG